ncbi:MAG: hypothetical protein ABI416_02135 [Ginsengibacter sp.]
MANVNLQSTLNKAMKKILYITVVFVTCAFLFRCQKNIYDASDFPVNDADAQKFIDSAGVSDNIQQLAINTFVKQLKDSSLWTKFLAIYPMVGGTENTTKWNLKDPRNSDAAYRLTFYGTPLYARTGILFNTLSDYADTHLADDELAGYADAAIAYYSRTQNTVSGYDMGCTDGAIPYNEMSVYSNSADKSEWFGFSEDTLSPVTTGLFMLSSTATNVTRYRNGIVVSSSGLPPNNVYTNLTILIGKSRITQHPGMKECALATIGNGLTDAQALTFSNIVQNFETALSR